MLIISWANNMLSDSLPVSYIEKLPSYGILWVRCTEYMFKLHYFHLIMEFLWHNPITSTVFHISKRLLCYKPN